MQKFRTLYFIIRFYSLFIFVKLLAFYFKLFPITSKTKDILYLESYPKDGSGYTYRVKHWKNMLIEQGYKTEALCVIPESKVYFKEATKKDLSHFIIQNIRIRIKQIIYSGKFKLVIVRRNLVVFNQYGNFFMEKLLKTVSPNIVLDLDDDIGAESPKYNGSFFQRLMLMPDNHFYGSLDFYKGFICGSNFLKKLTISKIQTDNLVVIPTCVNYTEIVEPKKYSDITPHPITFGWIGGNHNLSLLKQIIPALNKIHKEYPVQLLVIAGVSNYEFNAEFNVIFEKFSLETEISSMMKMDFGLMPLNDTESARAKCGFKLIQYMGLGIPGIASALTMNNEIIEDKINGWLVPIEEDWYPYLKEAVNNYSKLSEMSKLAAKTVKQRYSFEANADRYLSFIKQNLENDKRNL